MNHAIIDTILQKLNGNYEKEFLYMRKVITGATKFAVAEYNIKPKDNKGKDDGVASIILKSGLKHVSKIAIAIGSNPKGSPSNNDEKINVPEKLENTRANAIIASDADCLIQLDISNYPTPKNNYKKATIKAAVTGIKDSFKAIEDFLSAVDTLKTEREDLKYDVILGYGKFGRTLLEQDNQKYMKELNKILKPYQQNLKIFQMELYPAHASMQNHRHLENLTNSLFQSYFK